MSHTSKPVTKLNDHFATLNKQSQKTTAFQQAYDDLKTNTTIEQATKVSKMGRELLALQKETGVQMIKTVEHKTLIAEDLIVKGIDKTIEKKSGYVREKGPNGIRAVWKSQWSRS